MIRIIDEGTRDQRITRAGIMSVTQQQRAVSQMCRTMSIDWGNLIKSRAQNLGVNRQRHSCGLLTGSYMLNALYGVPHDDYDLYLPHISDMNPTQVVQWVRMVTGLNGFSTVAPASHEAGYSNPRISLVIKYTGANVIGATASRTQLLRKLNIIIFRADTSVESFGVQVLDSFDMDICKVGMTMSHMSCSPMARPEFYEAHNQKLITFSNTGHTSMQESTRKTKYATKFRGTDFDCSWSMT